MFKKPQSAFSILISIFFVGLFGFSLNVNAGGSSTITVGDTAHIYWNVAGGPTDSCSPSTSYPNVDTVYTSWTGPASYALVGDKDLGVVTRANPSPGWTFTCTNNGVPDTTTLVVNCLPGYVWDNGICNPADASFTGTPTCTIASNGAGCSSSISWTASYVDSVDLTDCSGGFYARTGSGSQTSSVYIPYNTGCYQIRKTSDQSVLATVNGSASCISGTAWNGSICTPPPTLTFGTSGTIDYNTASTLTWTPGSNPTSCTASGDWSGAKAIGGGSVSTGNLTSGKTYTLQCSNEAGDSPLRTVTVAVNCVTPWGTKVVNGNQVTSYETATVNAPSSCVSEQRTCTDGTLGGSYSNQSCVVKSGSISITDLSGTPTSSCVISANQSTCQVKATWTQSNLSSPAFYDANTGTNLGGTSGVAQTVYVAGGYPTGSTAFYLTDSTAFHYADTSVTSSCISGTNVGTTWNGTMCVLPTGTLTPTTPSDTACIIDYDQSSCSTSLDWATSYPIGESTILKNQPAADTLEVTLGDTSSPSPNQYSGKRTVTVTGTNPVVAYTLKNNGVTLDGPVTVTATCKTGSRWNGSVCIRPTGTLVASVNPCIVGLNQRDCTVDLNWTTSYPFGASAITSTTHDQELADLGDSGKVSDSGTHTLTLPGDYADNTFYLYNNGNILGSPVTIIKPTCIAGTGWDQITRTCVPPPVTTITALNEYLNYDTQTEFTWSQIGTSTSACTPGVSPWSNTPPPVGKDLGGSGWTGRLTADTTFTFQCTNPGGDSNVASVLVHVCPIATPTWNANNTACIATPGATITAGPSLVSNGAQSTISWSGTNADTCTMSSGDAGWSALGTVPSQPSSNPGSYQTYALTSTTTYRIYCSGPTGKSIDEKVVVGVCQAPTPIAYGATCVSAPTATIIARNVNDPSPNKNHFSYDARAKLIWNSVGTNNCTALSGNYSITSPDNGNELSGDGLSDPLSLYVGNPITYQCNGDGGQTPIATVMVTTLPASCTGSACSPVVPACTGTCVNAYMCPAITPTWSNTSLSCVARPTATLSVSTTLGSYNDTSLNRPLLTWSSSPDATTCTATEGNWSPGNSTNGFGFIDPADSLTITAKTYTLVCSGPGGDSLPSSVTISFCSTTTPTSDGVTCQNNSPVSHLTGTPDHLSYGGQASLQWWHEGVAESCSSPDGSIGSTITTASGFGTTGSLTSSTTYTYQCISPEGVISTASAFIYVCGPDAPAWDDATGKCSKTVTSVTINATPVNISYGATSFINWTASNAVSCRPTNGDAGWRVPAVAVSNLAGNYTTPSLTASTTYTINCSGAKNPDSDSVRVIVCDANKPTWDQGSGTCVKSQATLTLRDVSGGTHFSYGEVAKLTWEGISVSSCSATGAWGFGISPLSGQGNSNPLTTAQDFGYICEGPQNITVLDSVHLTVWQNGISTLASDPVSICPSDKPTWTGDLGKECFGPATASLTATVNDSPVTHVNYGQVVKLTWDSTDATECTPSGNWSNSSTFSGEGNSLPLKNDSTVQLEANTFGFQCKGKGGDSPLASVTIHVCKAAAPTWDEGLGKCTATPVTATLLLADHDLSYGQKTSISWTSNALSCEAIGSFDTKDLPSNDGDFTGNLFTSQDFALKCVNANGDEYTTPTQTINVCPQATPIFNGDTSTCIADGVAVNLSVDTAHVSYNTKANLSWDPVGATACTASGGDVTWRSPTAKSVTSAGMSTENLTAPTYSYTLTCTRPTGTLTLASDTVTIDVCQPDAPTWNGTSCVNTSGSITGNSCFIESGESTCEMSVKWNTSNPTGLVTVQRDYAGNSVFATGNNGDTLGTFGPGPGTFALSLHDGNNATPLDTANFTTYCKAGTGWTGTLCLGVTSSITSQTCTIPEGGTSCTMDVIWDVANTTGQVKIVDKNTGEIIDSGNLSGNIVDKVFNRKLTPYTYQVLLDNVAIKEATFTTKCIAGAGWINEACHTPTVDGPTIAEQYTEDRTLSFSCNYADYYRIIRTADGAIVREDLYVGEVTYKPSDDGYYNISCENTSLAATLPPVAIVSGCPLNIVCNMAVTPRLESVPPEPTVILNAVPKTLQGGTETQISWKVNFPTSACKLYALSVCTGASRTTCTPEQVTNENRVKTILQSENTDANDPDTSRPIQTAVKTIITQDGVIPWQARGKKTILINKSTDFFLECGSGHYQNVRVQVAKSNEG